MKTLLCLLILATPALAYEFRFPKGPLTCEQHKSICVDICSQLGGVEVFRCEPLTRNELFVKCECVDWGRRL